MKEDYDIDFVLPWVDSSDIEWQKSFNAYLPKQTGLKLDIGNERYRDWGLLKYWFRAVEKFAPWVKTIHFITSGQKPDFLNTNAVKLHFVKHEDFIKKEYLPVFSANPIEDSMYNIKGLSEHFVFFNDDFFLTNYVKKSFFFKKGLPCDSAVQNIATASTGQDVMHSIVLNNLHEINLNFNKMKVIRSNFFKWFNLCYGKDNIKNIVLSLWKNYVGFINPHFPQPFLKSEVIDCVTHCKDAFNHTISTRFKSESDVTQWLFRYWHLCRGKFCPISPYKDKRFFDLGSDNIEEICTSIEKGTYKTICLNDSPNVDFNKTKKSLEESFSKLLPTPSSFEVI